MASSPFRLDGKTAIVTGANGDIGLAIVTELATAGASVVCVQIDDDPKAVDAVRAQGRQAHLVLCDLTDPGQLNGLVDRCFALGPASILVNCAGLQRRGTVYDMTDEWLRDVMAVNSTAPFVLSRNFAAKLRQVSPAEPGAASRGKIVNICSTASYLGLTNMAAYTTSKHALAGTTRAFAAELGREGIQVNGIAPGYVATSFTKVLQDDEAFNSKIVNRVPAGRWASTRDIALPVVFLASEAANYMSGSLITVDGGFGIV